MKTKIEVEWKAKPSSGVTEIPLNELGVNNLAEWSALSVVDQKKRLDNWLNLFEEKIVAKATDDWEAIV